MMLPSRISCFSLPHKQWFIVLVDNIEDIRWNDESFRQLELAADVKDLVVSLVQGHGNEFGSGFDDFVEGKGKGLLFLLSGPPGMGKTLMSESIAERTKRLVYNISTGTLPKNSADLDSELSNVFKNAARWRTIVVLDEADVLMPRRKHGQTDLNSLTSVFLRHLEYFEGILFLTTNRADDFDEAIINRVHMHLVFNTLSATTRKRIWQKLIDINSRRIKVDTDAWTDKVYDILSEFEINGRSIKNILRTASAYARSKPDGQNLLHPRHVIPVVRANMLSSQRPPELQQMVTKPDVPRHCACMHTLPSANGQQPNVQSQGFGAVKENGINGYERPTYEVTMEKLESLY
ncbi:P-loop containing nucleoside triphosphate hydrolase protein [Ascobolus immersus RN42]|uniref:P-loop containing nucleoside triphosphate hydrolase protein n=1 Tax=Ascobolus immersus RN42 TaxID=1160509 RepID=A0A3N4I3L7_ASCIM|nr:P-loop containing nucleoside triphosphate hydrolase protein [Ascobolus immersus RN42]